MMKKSLLAIAALAVLLPACHRTSREVWEDTKSASRYMGKGLRSFMGRHVDTSDFAFRDSWEEDEGQQPLSLSDNDHYSGPTAGGSNYGSNYGMPDMQSPGMSDFGAGIPLSKESPGDPGSPIPGIDGFKTPDGALAALFKNVHFETDHYTVKGKENLEALQAIASYMIKHPNVYIFVEGHADERGAATYNLALGSRRANSVRTFLVKNGVNPDQLFTISYGKERPLSQNHDESAWHENRRAQFKVYER